MRTVTKPSDGGGPRHVPLHVAPPPMAAKPGSSSGFQGWMTQMLRLCPQ